MTLFIVYPWTATSLWNLRWNSMSFGPLDFRASLDTNGLKGRWALIYVAPIGLFMTGLLLAVAAGAAVNSATPSVGLSAIFLGFFLLFYLGIPLLTLNWYAKYFRQAAANTSLGELEFGFDATTRQWLGLLLGNLALAVVTLGFGITYWGYRNWSFMVRHLHIYGTIDIAELTQSTTFAPREAEGFADAFDVGAI